MFVRFLVVVCLWQGGVCRQRLINNIPPRQQWEANFGYCGETSLVQSILYYGGYVSQFDARDIASPGVHQSQEGSQLLLGVNAVKACDRVRLRSNETITSSIEGFLSWVKGEVYNSRPVILALYIKGLEDSDYDHIVTVVGYESDMDLRNTSYHASDSLIFDDHFDTKFVTSVSFSEFPRTRSGANAKDAPRYSLPKKTMYGLSVLGPEVKSETELSLFPVQVATNVSQERPAMKDGSNARPKDSAIQLNVTVSELPDGVAGVLCEWFEEKSIPTTVEGLRDCAATADRVYPLRVQNSTKFVLSEGIRSSEMRFFRATPLS